MPPNARALHGRHRTGVILAAVPVVTAVIVALTAPNAESWGSLLVGAMLALIAIAAFFSARWSLAGLAGTVVVLLWAVRESLRRAAEAGQQPDALDGLGYVLVGMGAVLGLLAVAVGAAIGWLRRRRLAAAAQGPRQALVG